MRGPRRRPTPRIPGCSTTPPASIARRRPLSSPTPPGPRSDWAAAGRYRVEALALIAQSLGRMPEAERAQFWTQVVRTDAALEPIRKSKMFLELEA